ncbi:uncharacterized protein K02A2.6-like [Rhagoletis pomonella]|uniref:uncharacterized protein K02A2.6-like n=1 Tax=Rhagoletis pomonella TaxID=28610 RepID=UPI00177E74C9|nr:uncharacterized protein K02A2.6-like [Rhagoletis pomonella]
MRQLARQRVWWVDIDKDIATVADKRDVCKIVNPTLAKEYVSWPDPKHPWERVHIDFAGPVFNPMWLICVDAFSKFPYISLMTTTTTAATISALATIFTIEGIPKTLASDNGPQLTSEEFNVFCTHQGIKHITSAPFHPASNGLAERFVITFKTAVKKNIGDGLQLHVAVRKYLSTYRFMPNDEGKSPAELLHGRPVRTLLSQVFESPKARLNPPAPNSPKFIVNQTVFARNYAREEKWLKAVIVRQLANTVYVVNTAVGYLKRHANQLKPRNSSDAESFVPWIPPTNVSSSIQQQPSSTEAESQQPTQMHNSSKEGIPVRRGARTRLAVDRYAAPDFRK